MRDPFLTDLLWHNYSSEFIRLNNLGSQFQEWIFFPGMEFESPQQWWNNKPRSGLHEGIDLLYFNDKQGVRKNLEPGTLVPPILDGIVVHCFDDYIGSTLVIAHDLFWNNLQCLSLYGHVLPDQRHPIDRTEKRCKEAVATIAPNPNNNSLPAHLHLSICWCPIGFKHATITWEGVTTLETISLLNPLKPSEWMGSTSNSQ